MVPIDRFKRAIYVATNARRANGTRVMNVLPGDGVTPNFHRVDLELDARAFMVMCNRTVPIVACADRIDGMSISRFAAVPEEIRASLLDGGFIVADADELNRRIGADDLQSLSKAEREQARYWRPTRISDVIFNWWD